MKILLRGGWWRWLFLLLWLCTNSALNAASLASIKILFPTNHSIWQVHYSTSTLHELVIHFILDQFQIPDDGYLRVHGEKIDGDGNDRGTNKHVSTSRVIYMDHIEPGSHFWTFELIATTKQVVAQTVLHIEVVVPQMQPLALWSYALRDTERKPTVVFNMRSSSRKKPSNTVCYVTSTRGLFDGQKKMWLQLIQALQSSPTTSWNIHVKTFEDIDKTAPLTMALQQLNLSITGLELRVPSTLVIYQNNSQADILSTLLTAFHAVFPSRLIRTITDPQLEQIQPQAAAHFWHRIIHHLRPCANGILVFANARSLSDVVLVTAARAAGVRSIVMEVANVDPFHINVDVLVAPSHFALYHPSVVTNVHASMRYVLATGINTNVFHPLPTPDQSSVFKIGYVGRLSTDKSIGLLIQAMTILVPRCRHCRLRLIGDGPLRSSLERLAVDWGIASIVEFVDGIYDELLLSAELQTLHVYVSPRFLETLGIAPLEAMSCGIPIIGFGTGGGSEYLEHNVNGLVVHEPSPEALADAIYSLVQNSTKREQLGYQARRIVEIRFSANTGIAHYTALYERLIKSHDGG